MTEKTLKTSHSKEVEINELISKIEEIKNYESVNKKLLYEIYEILEKERHSHQENNNKIGIAKTMKYITTAAGGGIAAASLGSTVSAIAGVSAPVVLLGAMAALAASAVAVMVSKVADKEQKNG